MFKTKAIIFIYFLTVLPVHEPVITGTKEQYQSGELLQANCTSNGSLPSATLEWKINNVPVSSTQNKCYWISSKHETQNNLSFITLSQHMIYTFK